MKLLQIVDSVEYVTTNCYQHQLLIDLRRNFDHTLVTLDALPATFPSDAVVLSTVKMRNVFKHVARFKAWVGNERIFVYDQDPWESFIDAGEYRGSYHVVKNLMPNVEFIVTSHWWKKFVDFNGFKVHFCRMWPLPEYCNVGRRYEEREHQLAFRGTLHLFRKKVIDEVTRLGAPVLTLPSIHHYPAWLEWLRTQGSFLHDEADTWLIAGQPMPKQCGMAKDVEVASQGCFVFRDDASLLELKAWGLDKVPCVITYASLEDCVQKVKGLAALSHEQANEMIEQSIETIANVDGWSDLRAILLQAGGVR